jgi:1-acyl-sn-glycerol-3-phosphate acyltransferase
MSPVADTFLERHPEIFEEDRLSYQTIRSVVEMTAPLERYYRFRCHGLERVPDGPCLVVANHSIGAVHEILLLLRAWYQRFGERPARGLAHQVAWQFPMSLLQVQKIGGIYAHRDVALRALKQGQALLVFPGGDLETFRPFSERYRVTLGGRSGFARLAREAGVPIVPVVFCGSHASYIVLPGADRMARWTGLHKVFGLKAFPLTGGLALLGAGALLSLLNPVALALLGGALAQAIVPLPSRFEAEVIDPITPRADESDEDLAERVRAAMQEAMHRLAAGRRTPWW